MTVQETFAISLITAVITSIVAPLVVAFINRHKLRSETELNFSQTIRQYIDAGGDISEMALKIASEYEKQVGFLRLELSDVKELVILQNDYIKVLVDVLRLGGLDIPPRPDKLRETSPRMRGIK